MIDGIKRRLQALEEQARKTGGRFTVIYRDGRRRKLQPGDCITEVLAGEVVSIEGDPGGGNGEMIELLRGLLDDGSGAEE